MPAPKYMNEYKDIRQSNYFFYILYTQRISSRPSRKAPRVLEKIDYKDFDTDKREIFLYTLGKKPQHINKFHFFSKKTNICVAFVTSIAGCCYLLVNGLFYKINKSV